MYVELYLLSNVVFLLHVKDTNPTTYVCDILIFLNVELSNVYLHVMYRLGL